MTYLLALDQGTSSSRSIVFDCARAGGGASPAGAAADLSAARLGRARPDGDLAHAAGNGARGAGQGRAEGRRHPRAGHHQPARNHDAVAPQDRPAGAPRHRLAGPPGRDPVRAVARAGPCRADPVAHRAGDRLVFFRHQDPLAAGQRAGRARTGAARGTGLRHGGQLAALATDGRGAARDRRDQRLAHHVVRHPSQCLGSGTAGVARCSRVADAPGVALQRALRRDRGRAVGRADRDRRGGGRPAGRAVRPGLLSRRHGQEHLRHRLLPADAHRAKGDLQPQQPVDDDCLSSANVPPPRGGGFGWGRAHDGSIAAFQRVCVGRQRVCRRGGGAVAARWTARDPGQRRGAGPGRRACRTPAA